MPTATGSGDAVAGAVSSSDSNADATAAINAIENFDPSAPAAGATAPTGSGIGSTTDGLVPGAATTQGSGTAAAAGATQSGYSYVEVPVNGTMQVAYATTGAVHLDGYASGTPASGAASGYALTAKGWLPAHVDGIVSIATKQGAAQ